MWAVCLSNMTWWRVTDYVHMHVRLITCDYSSPWAYDTAVIYICVMTIVMIIAVHQINLITKYASLLILSIASISIWCFSDRQQMTCSANAPSARAGKS